MTSRCSAKTLFPLFFGMITYIIGLPRVWPRVNACVKPPVSALPADPENLPCLAQCYCTSCSIRQRNTGPKTSCVFCLPVSCEPSQSSIFTPLSCFITLKCRSLRSFIYPCLQAFSPLLFIYFFCILGENLNISLLVCAPLVMC